MCAGTDDRVPDRGARRPGRSRGAHAARIHGIEDQVNPKRCGHLDGNEVVDQQTAIRRISACVAARRDPDMVIIARTDIRAPRGAGQCGGKLSVKAEAEPAGGTRLVWRVPLN